MIFLFIGLFLSSAAGDNTPDELNHYYYSGSGNNIKAIMYTEIDWRNCTSAMLIFSTKYDIGQGEDTPEGSTVTTGELQDAIHHWLEDLPVRGYTLSIMDPQKVISLWLSE